jgi:hypothetical protein
MLLLVLFPRVWVNSIEKRLAKLYSIYEACLQL